MSTISERSFCSSRDSPDGGGLLDPFVLLSNHMEHYQSTRIIQVKGNKVFCPICLEARSNQDVSRFEEGQYINYIKNIFSAIDRYGDTDNVRKILLTMLAVWLPKRPIDPQRDDRFYRMLRIFNKVMNSQLFNQEEFVMLVKILSNVNLEAMQPIPLKSTWRIWKRLLDYSSTIPADRLVGPEDSVTERMSEFVRSQATIIRTYAALLINVSSGKYSHHIFDILHKHEPDIMQEDHESSQAECLKFAQSTIASNISSLMGSESISNHNRQTILEMFGAMNNCFELSKRQTNSEFLKWLREWDPICKIHSLFYKESRFNGEQTLNRFLYSYVRYEIETLYGQDDLAWSMTDVNSIETRAIKIEQKTDEEDLSRALIFYILLNRVALKIGSSYYKRCRVKAIINLDKDHMVTVRESIAKSTLLMRVHAYIVTKIHTDPAGQVPCKRFLRSFWTHLFEQRRLSEFRELFFYEPDVFNWAHKNLEFCKMIDFETIDFITDRSLEQDSLNRSLIQLSDSPLRSKFASYLKKNSDSLFGKISRYGVEKIDKPVLDEFGGWLPSLLQETILAYVNCDEDAARKLRRCERIGRIVKNINLLLTKSKDFFPHFDRYFVMDFVKLQEKIYRLGRLKQEEKHTLIESHDLMALLMQSNNSCVMQLLQYMDFTLLGYMQNILDRNARNDRLTEAIARVLIARDELDYPLKYHIDEGLFSMPESAWVWMMSQNPDLHKLSLIVMCKIFNDNEHSSLAKNHYRNLPHRDRLCLETAFLQMLLNNSEMIKEDEAKYIEILKLEDFQFHPYYKYLLEEIPALKDSPRHGLSTDGPVYLAPTPDLTFDTRQDGISDSESIEISRLIASLEEEEGVGSTTGVPNNMFVADIPEILLAIDEQQEEFPRRGVMRSYTSEVRPSTDEVWELRANEPLTGRTQSSYLTTQRTTQGSG